MAAAVAHELAQTFLDKPWANAYPLSFLPDAGNAVRPTSSVRGGDEPVELDIELPVEEWGEVGFVQDSEARDAQEPAPAKRQRVDEPSFDRSRDKRPRVDLPNASSPQPDRPLSILWENATNDRKKRRKKNKKKQRRVYQNLAPPSYPPARPPIPTRQAPASSHDFVFDFAASPAPSEQLRNGPVFASSSSLHRGASPESPVLTQDMLFPSLRGLTFGDYRPLLLDRPITPVWSAALYELMLQFFHFCVARDVWSRRPEKLVLGELKPGIVRDVTALQPNHRAIQSIFQPGRAPGYHALDEHIKSKFRAMLDAMHWLFDDALLTVDAVAHLVRYAPLPLHILVRELASVIHLSELTQHAERELTQHLASLRRVSPHEAAVIVLLRWLQQMRTPNRHYVFFAHPDGSLRFDDQREPPWAWWFKRVEVGDPCTAEVLDKWEKGVLAEEDWSDFE